MRVQHPHWVGKQRSLGMTGPDPAAQKPSKTTVEALTGSGIVFPTTFASAWSRWRLIGQNLAPRELATRFTDTNSDTIKQRRLKHHSKAA
jgi:hypothetical protein